jgi:hypothetical protein
MIDESEIDAHDQSKIIIVKNVEQIYFSKE